MSPDTTGPWAHREEPPADLREVLRRLDLIERKIDWVARRVSPDEASTATTARPGAVPAGAADPQPAVPQPRAADSLSRPVLTQPAVPQPRPVIPSRPRPLPSPVQQRPVVPARRGWWRQARDEGNVGRYLLSGAAALLVLLAAVTLIALVWGSVADVVKVLVLGAVSICLVAGGTLLGRSRPRQAVAAATLAGTGGALGYVTVIGAVLLDTGLAPLGAFTLMSLWGVGLLLLSRVSAQGLTSVICALGGLLTVALSAHQVRVAAAQALPAWVLVDLLLLVLAVTSSALLRTQAGTRALLRPASPVALGAVLMAPLPELASASALLAVGLVLVPVAVLYAEAVDDALVPNRWRLPDGVPVAGAGATALLAYGRLLTVPGPGWSAPHGRVVAGIGVLLLLVVVSAVLELLRAGRQGWRRPSVLAHLAVVGTAATMSVLIEPALCLLAAVALVVSSLPAVSEACTLAVVIPVLVMLLALVQEPGLSCAERLGHLLALLVTVAAAPLLEWLLVTASGPAPGPRAASAGCPAVGASTTALARHHLTLLLSTWILAAALVGAVPTTVSGWLMGPAATYVPVLLSGAVTAGLVLAGVFRRPLTPLGLVRGQGLGPVCPVPPAPTALAWAGLVLTAVASVAQLAATAHTDGVVEDAAHVVMALALAVLAVRVLRPWLLQTQALMASAVLLSGVTWACVLILARTGVQGILMTTTVLATGSVCIVLGFRWRLTVLRHYGLVLVLVAVLKLAALDIGAQGPLTRVLALLASGLVCFGLSLAYNKVAHDAKDSHDADARGPQRP
ncbi:hypothetical protein [Actinomyces sp. W5033]|uniref:hypothetical protein n=1 Tax=Actinomyces sp. W5033 TaxID=3446479 RepID=UPI003EE14BE8